MKNKQDKNGKLKTLISKYGITQPSEQFSLRLKNMIVTQYRIHYALRYKKEERLGKFILTFVIATCFLILFQLTLSTLAIEVILIVTLFGTGVAAVISMLHTYGRSK